MTAAWRQPLLLAVLGLMFAEYAIHAGNGGLQIALLLLLLLPAALLAATDSSWLVTYVLAVWALGPEVRRVADWAEGQYHPLAPLSLAPMLATAALLLPIARHAGPLPLRLRQASLGFAAALSYGITVGALHHGLAVFYDGANYALPMLFLIHAALRPADPWERDKWVSRFATVASLVALYAWIQFLTAPPWDTFWMRATDLHSVGQPEAEKIRVFSTLNSPGPAGMFFASALVPMLLRSEWRGSLGWGGVLLTASALALTLVRAAWLMAFVGGTIYSLRAMGGHRKRFFCGMISGGVVLACVVPHLPGGEIIAMRVSTLGNLSQDMSFQARTGFTIAFLPHLLSSPLGSGLGSVGVAAKAESDPTGSYVDFDNGYWALLFTFGVAGACVFLVALWRLAQAARATAPHYPALSGLALATLASSLVGLAFVNVLNGVTGMLLWFLVSCSFGKDHGRHSKRMLVENRLFSCDPAGTGA